MGIGLLIESILIIGFAALGIWEGVRLLGVTSLRHMDPVGPGRYLLLLSGALFVCAAAHSFLQARHEPLARRPASVLRLGPAGKAWILLVSYAFAIPVVGYAAATVLFFPPTLYVFGLKSWPRSAVVGVALAAAFYFGFANLAGIMLP